jgi:diguanylate cyclase (GGDEF)-like protein/PAS domain S-box-containing protein
MFPPQVEQLLSAIPDRQAGFASRHEFLEAIFAALKEGIVVVAPDDRIVEASPAFCELVGFERDELIGADMPFPFFPPEEHDRFATLIRRLSETGGGDYEISLMRKDGTRFAVLAAAGTATDDRGAPLGRVISVRDVSGRRRREDRLAAMAATDELTGLLNRRSFHVHLAGEVARARRHDRPLSLAVLDLDGFKAVNTAGGHQAGDRVLAEAAGRLGARVRSGEHMARIGGDEFGWILPEADAAGAVAAVIRAREAIASEPFRGAGHLNLSAGICEATDEIDAAELFRRADRALYAAKTSGGGTVNTY